MGHKGLNEGRLVIWVQGGIPGGYLGNFHEKFHQFARIPSNSPSRIKVNNSDTGQGWYQDWWKVEKSENQMPTSKSGVIKFQFQDNWWNKSKEEWVDVCRSSLEAGLGGSPPHWLEPVCASGFARARGSSRQCHVGSRTTHINIFSSKLNPRISLSVLKSLTMKSLEVSLVINGKGLKGEILWTLSLCSLLNWPPAYLSWALGIQRSWKEIY